MNYNFTDRVRGSLGKAREEAARLGNDYVGTEHILLGLIREGGGTGASVLVRLGVDLAALAERIERSVRRGEAVTRRGEVPYTSRAKKVLEFSMAVARELRDAYVGTEHLLLGSIREGEGIAARVLQDAGVTFEKAREELANVRGSTSTSEAIGPRPRRRGRSEGVRPPERPVWYLEVDAEASAPIYEQIISGIEEAVATGRLEKGERLPSVRDLAEELGVAPGTVARAYSTLEQRGVLETEGARGTRVGSGTPGGKGKDEDRVQTLAGLLRPVAVAAFHMGAGADEVRRSLELAMDDIFREDGRDAGERGGDEDVA